MRGVWEENGRGLRNYLKTCKKVLAEVAKEGLSQRTPVRRLWMQVLGDMQPVHLPM